MAKYPCIECRKDVTATKNDRYRTHSDGDGDPCPQSSAPIPEHVLAAGPSDLPQDVPRPGVDYQICPQCDRKVKLTQLGYFEPHDQTLRGGDRCPVGGVRAKHAKRREDVLLPGDEKPGSVIPKVSAQQEITSLAPTSTNAGAGGSPTELPPTSGEGEIDWSDVTEGPGSGSDNSAGTPKPIDWSKVGDLKHLPQGTPEGGWEEAERLAASALPASSSASTETGSPPASTSSSSTSETSSGSPTPSPSPDTSSDAEESEPAVVGPFHLAPLLGDGTILQPFSHILQPTPYEGPVKVLPLEGLARDLATKIKETFYAYSNRKTNDNRGAQTTLGPSEIGTPCDRRLAMALMNVPAVNAGGDGWASFVGTCGHTGMAEIYTFADAGSGRYAVELPVFLGIPTVPRGTTDLLDRRDGTVVDWKFMGSYSLKKFKAEGPSDTYRTQAHVYGYGAKRAGEKVKNVAVVGLPRAGSSLDEMHVWTEPYDEKLAKDALARVEKIHQEVYVQGAKPQMQVAATFPAGDDCRYCPFHLKGDKEMVRGCPGK